MAGTRKRTLTVVAVLLFALAALVVVVFALGKPVTPQASSRTAAPAEAAAPEPAADAPAAPGGGVSEADPLAIEIPGCVCHSDDPAVVEAHASYRMSQCFDCHQGGMPEM